MDKIRTLWEKRSEKYGTDPKGVLLKSFPVWLNNVFHRWTIKQLERAIKDQDRILDLGCGYGRVAEEILKKYQKCRIAGLDISQNYVDIFNSRLKPRGVAYQGTITDLKFKANSFDLVFIMATLIYLNKLKEQKLAIREIFRVLKPGGKFVIIERNPIGHSLMTLGGLITFLRGRKNKEIKSVSFPKKKIENLIREAGGTIFAYGGFPFGNLINLSLYIAYIGKKNGK